MRRASKAWVLAAVLATSRAWAQDAPSATELESLLSQANELRRGGRDEDAVVLLRRAASLDQGPRTLAQLALGEQSIGRWSQSEALFLRALAGEGDPWIERHRAALEVALAAARAHLATVDVVGGDPAAELWVDGELVGPLREHRQLRVVTGNVRIEHRPRTGPAAVRVLELSAGAHERVYFARGASDAAPVQAERAMVRPPPPAPLARRPPALHGLLWVGAAVGGAALTSNLISWAVAQSIVQRYDEACHGRAALDSNACLERLRAEQPQLDAIGTVTDVGWVLLATGLATSGVGVALSVRERSALIRGQF